MYGARPNMYTTVIDHFEVVTLGQCVLLNYQVGTLWGGYCIGYYHIVKKLG